MKVRERNAEKSKFFLKNGTQPVEEPSASKYRAAVGLLLYMSTDLVDCQYCIKTLAQCMAHPGAEGWKLLKHLCFYLVGVRYNAICFEQPILYDGLVMKRCPSAMVLETCTDSDWSGDKETRKSTSSAVFLLNKNCVYRLHAILDRMSFFRLPSTRLTPAGRSAGRPRCAPSSGQT